jgi:hypothetical protein
VRGIAAWTAAVCLAAPAAAEQRTQRFDYRPSHHVQEIEFALDHVRIRQVVFRSGPRAGDAAKRKAAECTVRVDNDGQSAVAVGVAVVVFDAEGNVVAAGTGGTRVGWLWPGERDTSTIRFPFVYRNFDKARTFLITMEVEGKPPKEAPAPKPVP